jgi:hypothetical protein
VSKIDLISISVIHIMTVALGLMKRATTVAKLNDFKLRVVSGEEKIQKSRVLWRTQRISLSYQSMYQRM